MPDKFGLIKKAMDKDQFDNIDDSRKGQILNKDAILVGERIYKCFKILLFQLNHYYVEVYFHIQFNIIQYVRSFDDMDDLDPYVSEINIESLLKG